MTKKVQGIVHGKTIELAEDLGVSDGQAVEITVRTVLPRQSTPCTNTQTAAGALTKEWSEEDDRILEELHRERKGARWRTIPE